MRALIITLLIVALSACGGAPEEDAGETAGPTAHSEVVTPEEEALSLAQRLDDRLPFGAAESRTVAVPEADDRTLRLWRENGQPMKLLASEPEDAGVMATYSAFYFDRGELFLVSDPYAHYVFEDGRLTTWLDDLLNPVDVTEADRATREARILERVERYLAEFE